MAVLIPEAGFGADASAPVAFSTLQPISKGTVEPTPPRQEPPTPVSPPTTVAAPAPKGTT